MKVNHATMTATFDGVTVTREAMQQALHELAIVPAPSRFYHGDIVSWPVYRNKPQSRAWGVVLGRKTQLEGRIDGTYRFAKRDHGSVRILCIGGAGSIGSDYTRPINDKLLRLESSAAYRRILTEKA